MRRKREFNSNDAKIFFFNEVFHQHTKGRDILLTHIREGKESERNKERDGGRFSGGTFSCKLCVYIYKYGSALLRERALSFLSLSLFPSLASGFELSLLFFFLLLLLSFSLLTARSFRRRLEERKVSPIFLQPRKGALTCRLRCL